jgi:hypothetical protein
VIITLPLYYIRRLCLIYSIPPVALQAIIANIGTGRPRARNYRPYTPPYTYLAISSYYNSQASTYRADFSMSGLVISSDRAITAPTSEASWRPDQTTSGLGQEIATSANLAKLRAEGRTLTTQKLKELETRVTALEKIARIEDRLHSLESRKRASEIVDEP